tara:strand:+ start:41 stop:259 length:219 start_codon:yes stop_codon:yes gene_type:complete
MKLGGKMDFLADEGLELNKYLLVRFMGRPNWHYDHPPACTCVECSEKRTQKNRNLLRKLQDLFLKIRRGKKF